ncbi:MAG TPA: type III-A CRISPR-associated protein Csm2 [Spirochaetota bacterium]|nr:type III-A CRISPR-associated protein Csm2 [Spirochaetota bacterium]
MIQLTEDYLTKTAEEQARLFANKFGKRKGQLRKFYDDLKIIDRRLLEDENEERFKSELLPLVKFVKAKIAYSVGRKVQNEQLVPIEFKKYMDAEIDKIQSIADFKNFLYHYQAIISYFMFITEAGDNARAAQGQRR